MVLITGIYERLIHFISKINFKFLKPLFRWDLKSFTRLARGNRLRIAHTTSHRDRQWAVLTVSISFMITYLQHTLIG